VRSLLMGGQACIVYGGAEFSRDTDILVLADEGNLARLAAAVGELQAAVIAVPPFEKRYLDAGHAVHFRCRATGVEGMRLDVMARVRGLPGFEDLWQRRSSVDIARAAPEALRAASAGRPLLAHALTGETRALATALRAEEDGEREADRKYWAPLRAELERLRAERRG